MINIVFTDSGKNRVRDYFAGVSPGAPIYAALGSIGSPVFVASDTALRFEVDATRRTFDSNTGSTLDKLVEFEMILPSTEPSGLMPVFLREIEISSGSPADTGSVFSLNTFAEIEKTEDIELQNIVAFRIE